MPLPPLTLRADIGQPLTVLQFDDNHRRHEQRIDDVEANPPAVVPTNLTQDGTIATLHFSNATSYPFTLPIIRLRWRGEWTPATVYLENDIVVVTADGVYLVLEDHTSDTTFDPAEANTDGPFYLKMIGAGADGAIGPEGPQGDIGPSGGQWFTGTGEPDPGLGSDGDFYLDDGTGTDGIGSGDIYEHQGTDGWVLVANISGDVGPQGPEGPEGPEGPQGASGAGSTIIVEEGGVPTSSPVSNLNFDDSDFNVSEDTTGLVTVSLTASGGGALQGTGYTSPGVWKHSVDGTVTQVIFTDLSGASFLLTARAVTKSVSTVLHVHVSTDNGSTWHTTSGNYLILVNAGTTTNTTAFGGMHETNATAARDGFFQIWGNVAGAVVRFARGNDSSGLIRTFVANTSLINAIRITPPGGGNLTGGEINCVAQ